MNATMSRRRSRLKTSARLAVIASALGAPLGAMSPRIASLAATSTVGDAARPQQLQSAAPSTGQPIGGIACDAMEGQRLHMHQHLVVLDHGRPVSVPANVGQVPERRCLYWVHTHTPDGIIHIEAPLHRTFTLSDFFQIWGQPLSPTQAATAHTTKGKPLRIWVDGRAYHGDPRNIVLTSHTDIVIEAGPPFPKPPRFVTWGTL
jgi:hypothetical protein